MLGPTLFLIYINDIDNAVNVSGSVLAKFADDTKWAMVVETEEDRRQFQQGLEALMEWSREWQMLFNVDKCKVIHAGTRNQGFKYEMGGNELEEVEFEKDVGVLIHKSLRPSMQCAKANSVLGQLTRAVSYRDKKTFMSLYATYVRPHLEYAVQAWCPWTIGDKEALEKVQKRAVGMVTNLKGGSYKEKLAEMQMSTLEDRRKRGDLIQMFRVMSGRDRVDTSTWFKPVVARQGALTTRLVSGYLNVERTQGRTEMRRNFWSVRVVDTWNSLPDTVKASPSVDTFKNSIDNLLAGGRI